MLQNPEIGSSNSKNFLFSEKQNWHFASLWFLRVFFPSRFPLKNARNFKTHQFLVSGLVFEELPASVTSVLTPIKEMIFDR